MLGVRRKLGPDRSASQRKARGRPSASFPIQTVVLCCAELRKVVSAPSRYAALRDTPRLVVSGSVRNSRHEAHRTSPMPSARPKHASIGAEIDHWRRGHLHVHDMPQQQGDNISPCTRGPPDWPKTAVSGVTYFHAFARPTPWLCSCCRVCGMPAGVREL
jgi:hypothetical protein